MRDRFWIGLRLLLFLVVTPVISGCTPEWPPRRQVTPPPPPVSAPPTASTSGLHPDRVEARIGKLEGLLSLKDALNEEQQNAARRLLDGYRRVLAELRAFEREGSSPGTAVLLFDQIVALEDIYFQPSPPRGDRDTGMLSLLAQEQDRIQTAYISGDYRGVVQTCAELEKRFGRDALCPETGVLLALALAEEGDTRKAIAVAERTLSRLEGHPDPFHLRSRLVAWYAAMGERKRASDQWDRLTDTVREQEGLLESARQTLVQGGGGRRPGSAGIRKDGGEVPAPGALNDLLKRVDGLIQSRAFDRAKLLLIRHRIQYPEGPETEAMDRALERVERAEREALPETMAPRDVEPSSGNESLKEARRLMEMEDYEGALDILDDLDGVSGPDAAEVKALAEAATSRFIQVERDKAARMFLEAKHTTDPVEKAGLLRSSHALLRGLLDRFPRSPLAPRIESNLDTVIQEMKNAGLSYENGKRSE